MTARSVYATRRWYRVREAILLRDRGLCQLGLPGCTTQATEVDHIVPVSRDGSPFSPANLRAACKPCNSRRGSALAHGRDPGPSRNW